MPNKQPKANKLAIAGFEDGLIQIVLSGSDPDGTITGYTLTSLPSHGTLYLDLAHTQSALLNVTYASNTFYFLPDKDFSGNATFSYSVRDNQNATSPTAAVTINITNVNDSPVLDLNGAAPGTSTTLNYLSAGGVARIAPAASVTDIDLINFAGGTLRASISQNGTSADRLTIDTDLTVTVANTAVFVGGIKVGTISTSQNGANGSDLLINLVNGATPAAVSTLLEHIGYSNTSVNPLTPSRTVTFTVVDGDGVANGGQDTSIATAMINFPTNQAPTAVVLSNAVTSTAENGAATKVADVNVTDDALGNNVLSLSGADAGSFALVSGIGGKELWFNGGANFEAKAAYDVTVAVDDAAVGGSPDASTNFHLTVSDVNDADAPVLTTNPASGQAGANIALSITVTPVDNTETLGLVEIDGVPSGSSGYSLTAGTEFDSGPVVSSSIRLGRPCAKARRWCGDTGQFYFARCGDVLRGNIHSHHGGRLKRHGRPR